MAAHLHRYSSELGRLEFIVSELLSRYPEMSRTGATAVNGDSNSDSKSTLSAFSQSDTEELQLHQLMSQLKAIRSFGEELERKVQNILTLVSGSRLRSIL
jgi:hypothetical protein